MAQKKRKVFLSLRFFRKLPLNQNLIQKRSLNFETQMQKTLEGKDQDEEEEEGDRGLAIWDCGSPLYDSYELVTLGHIIDRHLMALPHVGGSKRLSAPFPHANNVVVTSIVSSPPGGSFRGSSMVGRVKEFAVIRKMWKRKVVTIRRWKETKTWLSALRKRIGLWRK
ncbi:uncharacterized protein LOC132188616 [Corylus avellana]|uniref:uncharacterized protein LOC132188616 n=1 Tax=Corylus avellana TaxID=13451 RepID=UPI00286AF1D4|nr:uncharacterized protein LOC132188616 [Corylus avellana]